VNNTTEALLWFLADGRDFPGHLPAGLLKWRYNENFQPYLHDWSVKVVTKQDIVRTICERLDLPKAKAQEAVQTTFDALITSLVKEGRVELRNFGVFQIKRRAGRVGRNPRTGDIVNVPPRYFVSFKPGKEMDARVRELDKQKSS
jgi:DNA-binding protein HU-beta/integration host factor subunit beta